MAMSIGNILNRYFSHEVRPYGFWVVGMRTLAWTKATLHGRLLGWQQASVPPSSTILGTKYIEVMPGFFASGPVWIEAISSYGNDAFSPSIHIGRDLRVSRNLHISAIDHVSIGNNCLLGSNVYIADHSHGDYRARDFDAAVVPALRPLAFTGAVNIADNCWIGDNAVILGGVTIGAGAIVAANSVVLHDVSSMTMVAGAPAKVIKEYSTSSGKWIRSVVS